MSEVEVTENDKVVTRMFDWCSSGQHDRCKRTHRRFVLDNKNKIVWLDEVVQCACKKRGCKCYVKPADRPTPVKKRRRKK